MKSLIIGDPHATVDELEDVEALMTQVQDVAKSEAVDTVLFLGDLHHSFSLTNVKVVGFWKKWFSALAQDRRVQALVGNHDMPGDGSSYPHALIPYEEIITVYDKPTMENGVLYVPYIADPNLFLSEVNKFETRPSVVVCHQLFNGAMYENSFYAPEGVDPGQMVFPVISGHIHTPQQLGNVWYPGAPRWRTISDADVPDRYVYVVTLHPSGGYTIDCSFSTKDFVKRIVRLNLTPETPEIPEGLSFKDDFRVHIEGPSDFVLAKGSAVKERLTKAKISTIVTDRTQVTVRESDGIEVAFQKYLAAYKSKYGTAPESLVQLARERL